MITKNSYIAHHGVKGQRHGVRRYQYEDGSLTPLGREHYGVGQGKKRSLLDGAGKDIAKAVRNAALAETTVSLTRAATDSFGSILHALPYQTFLDVGGYDMISAGKGLLIGVGTSLSPLFATLAVTSAAIAAGKIATNAYLGYKDKKAEEAAKKHGTRT